MQVIIIFFIFFIVFLLVKKSHESEIKIQKKNIKKELLNSEKLLESQQNTSIKYSIDSQLYLHNYENLLKDIEDVNKKTDDVFEKIHAYKTRNQKKSEQKEKPSSINLSVENYNINKHEYATDYCEDLKILYEQNALNFFSIRQLSVEHLKKFSQDESNKLFSELNRGISIITTENHLHKYNHAYGKMHRAKILESLKTIENLGHIISNKEIQITDYGCGQGIGSIVFIEYLKNEKIKNITISKVILVEPSEIAIKRASLNINYYLKSINQNVNILSINKSLDNITNTEIYTNPYAIKFHIFSNILDVTDFNLYLLFNKINQTQNGINYFICVSPNFKVDGNDIRNLRLKTFSELFKVQPISQRFTNIENWSRYEIVFKVNFDINRINNVVNLQNDIIDDLPF